MSRLQLYLNTFHVYTANNEYISFQSLPIFALHPKGSHYIPMHVSEEVIVPYLHLFEQSSELPLMLHPVTISVNFCGPLHLAASNVSSRQNGMEQELVQYNNKY